MGWGKGGGWGRPSTESSIFRWDLLLAGAAQGTADERGRAAPRAGCDQGQRGADERHKAAGVLPCAVLPQARLAGGGVHPHPGVSTVHGHECDHVLREALSFLLACMPSVGPKNATKIRFPALIWAFLGVCLLLVCLLPFQTVLLYGHRSPPSCRRRARASRPPSCPASSPTRSTLAQPSSLSLVLDRQGAVMPCVAFSVLLQLQRLQQPPHADPCMHAVTPLWVMPVA